MIIQTVDEKFRAAVSHINAQTPWYMRFYNLFNRKAVADKNVTLRINMMDSIHPIIEYNEDWLYKINSASLAVLLCAEINRILLRHCSKRQLPDHELNYKCSNIVCYDPSIASLFQNTVESVDFGEALPNDANPTIRAELPADYDHKRDCQLEVLYEMLSKKQNGGGMPPPPQPQGGQPKPQPQNGNNGGNNNNSQNQMRDALNQHFANISNSEKWGENDIAEANVAQRVNTTDASQWGSMPGDLRERIMAANRQVVDPRIALRNFIATAYSDYLVDSRMKYNRRNPEWSGILPGKRHDQTFHLGIFADASGSMGRDDIELCIATTNDFIKFEAEVDFAWWDCNCEMPTEQLKPMASSDCFGGGGTNPQCIIELIRKHKLQYDGIIVLTDCGFCWERPKEWRNIFIIRTPTAVEAPKWVGKNQMSMKEVKDFIAKKKH